MPWWGWIAIGALMLSAELAFIDAEFYLVFLGVAALLVGGVELSGTPLPWWGQWLLFAGLAVGSLVFFRQRVYVLVRPPPEGEVPEGVEGDVATAREAIEPGDSGEVDLRGSSWTAENTGTRTIAAGERCMVERSAGVRLRVRPMERAAPGGSG